MSAGDLAYTHARLRAWRSRLLRRPDVLPLLAARDAAAHTRALAAIGAATGGEAREHAFERLLNIYRIAIRGYREHALLFLSLLRLHEVENIKLAWRAIARYEVESQWHALWRPLGSLGSVTFEQCRAAESLADLVDRLAKTPYGEIVKQLYRAHRDDGTAFEFGLDRWASQILLAEAAKLRATEPLAASLVESVVRSRDAQIRQRGETAYGLSASAAAAQPHLSEKHADVATLLRRASRGGPLSLAPGLAVVLLAESELRAVIALTERHGREELDAAIENVLAPSLMGVHT